MKKIILSVLCFSLLTSLGASATEVDLNYSESVYLGDGLSIPTASITHPSTDTVGRLRLTSNSSANGNGYVDQYRQVAGADEQVCIRSAYMDVSGDYVECTYSTGVSYDTTYGYIWFNTAESGTHPFTYIID